MLCILSGFNGPAWIEYAHGMRLFVEQIHTASSVPIHLFSTFKWICFIFQWIWNNAIVSFLAKILVFSNKLIPCHFTILTIFSTHFLCYFWLKWTSEPLQWRSSDPKSELFNTHIFLWNCPHFTPSPDGLKPAPFFQHSFWPNSEFFFAFFCFTEHKFQETIISGIRNI